VMPALVQQRMLTYQANEDSENSRHLANHQWLINSIFEWYF
jgi:hypothetical protein